MNVAVTELRRRPGRFVTATVILTLLATLLLLLGGLLDGLINGATSAVAGQRGDVIVYASTAERSFLRSRITPEERAVVEQVDGVERVGGLGVAQLGARVPGNEERDLADVALYGYEIAPEGVPAEAPAPGTAYADRSLESQGVREGMTLQLGPARTPIEVIGWVEGLVYSGQGTLWASPDTWREVVNANRPDAGVGDGVFQSLVVQGDGVAADTLAGRIDEATGAATDSLSLPDAVEAIPGVKEQRGTFNQIIGVTLVIAVVVVALFFALLTVERTGLYGVLKAIGATSGRLFGGVVLQAVVVTFIAALIGTALAVVLDLVIPPGTIPYTLLPSRVLSSVLFLLVAAVVGCAFSLRRVLRIDPASAIGSAT
jgi:putative ABC transport system permease protein